MKDIIFIAAIFFITFLGVWFFTSMSNIASIFGPSQLLIIGACAIGGLIFKIWNDDREFSQPNH